LFCRAAVGKFVGVEYARVDAVNRIEVGQIDLKLFFEAKKLEIIRHNQRLSVG
jgi:hypothetical protein